ncbi:MAG: sensor histidine kinase [Microthrixaceae bacterium]
MSLRLKLVLALVALSTAATVAVGVFAYRTTSQQLNEQVDQSLREAVGRLSDRRGPDRDGDRYGPPAGGPLLGVRPGDRNAVTLRVLDADGAVLGGPGTLDIPVSSGARTVAASSQRYDLYEDATVVGDPYRVLTSGVGGRGGALQGARSVVENRAVLDGLRSRILVAGALVIAAAAAVGWFIARQVTRRLEQLTAAAEEVTVTGRLDVQVPGAGTDETGRLAGAFNSMLAALSRSKEDQQRLVQDAGHELRTPLTSLRANVYALRRADRLTAADRERVLDDLEGETEELTQLVNEVVELATDRREEPPTEVVALTPLAERVAARAAQRSGRPVEVRGDGTQVLGRTPALERAVGNLVENALKFDDSDGPVTVTVVAGRVEVADSGPGVAEEDLPMVFDRFYRATSARSRPGSGLGLSIVRDVAESHGGTVFVANRPEGGAVVGFQLPVAAAAS